MTPPSDDKTDGGVKEADRLLSEVIRETEEEAAQEEEQINKKLKSKKQKKRKKKQQQKEKQKEQLKAKISEERKKLSKEARQRQQTDAGEEPTQPAGRPDAAESAGRETSPVEKGEAKRPGPPATASDAEGSSKTIVWIAGAVAVVVLGAGGFFAFQDKLSYRPDPSSYSKVVYAPQQTESNMVRKGFIPLNTDDEGDDSEVEAVKPQKSRVQRRRRPSARTNQAGANKSDQSGSGDDSKDDSSDEGINIGDEVDDADPFSADNL